MAYFRTCPRCGAALDPGEACECSKEDKERARKWQEMTRTEEGGQIALLPIAQSKGDKEQ